MNIKCPHCGTEYEVEKKDMYRYTTCEACGKGFVVGAETSLLASDSDAPRKASTELPQSGKFVPRRTQRGSSRAERIAIPGRFACPQNDAASASSSGAQKIKPAKKKWMILFGVIAGGILIACATAFGAYMFFGDEPQLCRGIACYENGLHSKAYKILLPLAKKGYAKAQLCIGDCHGNGLGVFMDTEEAVKWYRLAADQDLPEAQHRMFACCSDGVGIERNSANAAKWCRKAADAGLEEAIYDMGMLYVNGTGVEQNAKSAFKWFRKGAERGHPMCLYKFGQCYKLGYGVEKDEDEASKWQNKAVTAWRASANAGDTASMVRLAELYMKGDVVELDKEESVKWYRKGAELGNEMAQYELATCYHNGEGVEEDQEESAKWMMKAAEKCTDRGVQWAMGRYYQEGWGVEKSPVEAVKWFERSAKKGFDLAKYYLAMCYMNGEGVQKDVEKAEALLKDAAGAGCKEAEEELSRIKKEREELDRRIASEKANKNKLIETLASREDIIEECIERINNILAGKLSGEWSGFNASKITATDSSVSVKEEPSAKLVSERLSDADSLETIERAIAYAVNEVNRLQARLDKINAAKKMYDAKELESRKETCAQCKGAGTIVCARCKGKGEIQFKESRPCPTCVGVDDDEDEYGAGYSASSDRRKGKVKRTASCSRCKGRGTVYSKCSNCNGVGKITVEEPGRLRDRRKCPSCGGSGSGDAETCPRCNGGGNVEVWSACQTCSGQGTVSGSGKETCPVCEGKGQLKCERCDGRGFTYRPRNP